MTAFMEIGPAMWRNNRRIAAERLQWPDGTLAMCEWLEVLQPGVWWVSWQLENTCSGFEHPAAYVAYRLRCWDVVVCGTTVAELLAAMLTAPAEEHRWSRRGLCCYTRKPVTRPQGSR